MLRGTNERQTGQSSALQRLRRRNISGHHATVPIATLAVAISLVVPWCPDMASAEEPLLQQMAVAYQNGTITAIYETTFQIDGRTFGLAPGAVLQDDTGKEIEASALVVTAEVKYRLKEDQHGKIDRMIVTLPR